MEFVSTRQLAPATIIGAMFIKTNCTFQACDFSCFESNNHFHSCCMIKFWLLGIFVFILHEHDCHAVMTWSFRLIVVMVIKI